MKGLKMCEIQQEIKMYKQDRSKSAMRFMLVDTGGLIIAHFCTMIQSVMT